MGYTTDFEGEDEPNPWPYIDRFETAWKKCELWLRFQQKAIKEGRLPENCSDEQVDALMHEDVRNGKLTSPFYKYIGDDISDEDITLLWDHFFNSKPYGWWDNKPHQVMNRVLCRLTRAEHPRKE